MRMDDALEKLQHIPAKGPTGNEIQLTVSEDLIRMLAATGQINRLFQYFYLICGAPPPVNNIGYHERHKIPHSDGMKAAQALFRGLKRPFQEDGADGEVYVYVMRPLHTFKYVPGMVCVAKLVPAPESAIFTVNVRFAGRDLNSGVIIGWDWIQADKDHPDLPTDFNERFDQEVWNNG